MLLHRYLLIALGAAVLIALAAGPHYSLIAAVLLVAIYAALAWSAVRLAAQMGLAALPFPFWLLYITGGLGPFASIWLDREARRELASSGAAPGFLTFRAG